MHVRTRHEHKRPFKCTYCEHTFGRLSHLRKHVKKVCGPNKQEKQASTIFQCKFCEVVFPSKVELRKHSSVCEKKESKAKPSQVALHVCNICNKDFASPYNVRRHQLTHSDDRPFECEYCSKSFKEKSSLTKHVKRVHLGKSKDEPLEANSGELMVSITNQDQQFDVVSMANEGNLLTATVQSSTGVNSAGDTGAETASVDTTTLVHVAASVMVEELLHGEDQNQEAPTAVTTTVTPSASQQDMFIAETEKSDVKVEESDAYNGQVVSNEAVSSLAETTPEITTNEGPMSSLPKLLCEEAAQQSSADSSGVNEDVQVSSSQFADDQQDAVAQGETITAVKNSQVEEGPGDQAVKPELEPVELSNAPGEGDVTSTETTSGQISV